jgi:porin
LGLWTGVSLTVHGEYNYGDSVNGRGGTLIPVNTALQFPGIDGADAFDLSSVYVSQSFANSSSLVLGKINMMDAAANKPFMGGAGIDSFWNCSFVAPPSGTVPPYLFGALMTFPTPAAVYSLWVYDPTNKANQSVFDNPFEEGVTVRGGLEWPVTLGGLPGHQGFVASYSTQDGTDLESLGDALFPPLGSVPPGVKDERYYGAYTFDQSLFQSKQNPKEGVGLFRTTRHFRWEPQQIGLGGVDGAGRCGAYPRTLQRQLGPWLLSLLRE